MSKSCTLRDPHWKKYFTTLATFPIFDSHRKKKKSVQMRERYITPIMVFIMLTSWAPTCCHRSLISSLYSIYTTLSELNKINKSHLITVLVKSLCAFNYEGTNIVNRLFKHRSKKNRKTDFFIVLSMLILYSVQFRLQC